jgi:hypothetical protein
MPRKKMVPTAGAAALERQFDQAAKDFQLCVALVKQLKAQRALPNVIKIGRISYHVDTELPCTKF